MGRQRHRRFRPGWSRQGGLPDSAWRTGCPLPLAFAASSAAQVDEFHQVGVRAGFVCNGQPGLRPHYAPNYYAAFLLDPDGNNIEALAYLDPPGMASM